MEHEHTQHVAADAAAVYDALRDPGQLAQFVPQLTAIEPRGEEKVEVEARYDGHAQHGEAWLRTDDERRRVSWGAEGSDYHGWIQVDPDGEGSRLTLFLATVHGDASDQEIMGTLDAIRRLVESRVD